MLGVGATSAADVVHDGLIQTAAIGSCNKQHRPQPLWTVISQHEPQAFIWIGDAVYPNQSTVDALRTALEIQRTRQEYAAFVAKVPVIEGRRTVKAFS